LRTSGGDKIGDGELPVRNLHAVQFVESLAQIAAAGGFSRFAERRTLEYGL
jgi:hypothetical protein